MILFILFITVCSINSVSLAKKSSFEPYIRFTSSKCLSSSKSVSGFDCYVKAYSRTNTTLNFSVNLSRPLFDVMGRYDLTYKYLTNSQRSVINATMEICESLNGTASNPVFKWIIGLIKNVGNLIHPCPYKGTVSVKDLSVDLSKFVSVFPGGNYVTSIRFYDTIDENIITLKYTQELVSYDKKGFK